MKDVRKVAKAFHKDFNPYKVNYRAYSDKMKHLHFNLVLKYKDCPSWENVFEINLCNGS
ncbi:hypothetical protein [Clostridium beijerinckii]|uniref:hypothetical protein n=1 Tax=Clostridium beijerinckii TaxID=1520 RepID=UPI000A5F6478|nr:hypothetical protein [Clostridium beijerinckii]